uniref:Uncharacterized protein n=1 Tax=Syphacia muris TaxID=451379 RepID=A0A0N5ALZ6_9BILA
MSRSKNREKTPTTPTGPKRWRSRSSESDEDAGPKTPTRSVFDVLSPLNIELELIDRLERMKKILAINADSVDARDLEKESQSAKEYILLRDKLRASVPDPEQFDSKTDLNLGGAAIAGAKVMVDESRTTRSMSRRLVERCGISEQDFLYKGLRGRQRETICARNIAMYRRSAVIESLVDFQKQIDFKGKVLKHIASRLDRKTKSDSRIHCSRRLRALRDMQRLVLKTPRLVRRSNIINPLDDDKIMDSFALRIAIEAGGVSRRRSLGTIPFNRAWLDED